MTEPNYLAELVRLDFVFSDETFTITDAMTRYEAQYILRSIGEFGNQPMQGKTVKTAIIIPLEGKNLAR